MTRSHPSKSLDELFSQNDRGYLEARNVPAKLFRLVLFELGISKSKWERLLKKTLDEQKGQKADGRGNIVRALVGKEITWESMQRGLRVLNPKRVWVRMDFEWNPKLEFPGTPPAYVEITSDTKRDDLLHIFKEHLLPQLGIRPGIWNELVTRYIQHLGLYSKDRRHEGSDKASNLKKALFGSEGTGKVRQIRWSRFCEALVVFQIRRVTLTVTLEFRRSKTQHTLTFTPEDEIQWEDGKS